MNRALTPRFQPSAAFMELVHHGASKIHMPLAYRRKELHTTSLRLLREMPARVSAIRAALEASQ